MYKTKELKEKRGEIVNAIHQLVAKGKAENRALNADERATFDRLDSEQKAMQEEIEGYERMERYENSLFEERTKKETKEYRQPGLNSEEERNKAWKGWLLEGTAYQKDEYRQAAQQFGMNSKFMNLRLSPVAPRNELELRAALGKDSGSIGGYTVQTDVLAAVEQALLAYGGVRQVAHVVRTAQGNPFDLPNSDDTGNMGEIVGENSSYTELEPTFGQVALGAYKYSSKYVKVGIELLQDSVVNVPQLIGGMLGKRIARKQSLDFTTGDGSNKPYGVVAKAHAGFTMTTGHTTDVTYSALVDLTHSVDPAYREEPCSFMMHDTTLAGIEKLVDGQGRPLLNSSTDGISAAPKKTLLGYPVVVNQSMATPAANAKTILFGAFGSYWIRDVLDIQLIRCDELFALSGQVAFVAIARSDANLNAPSTAYPIVYLAQSSS
jgi:HK97 family phage major capsid protein